MKNIFYILTFLILPGKIFSQNDSTVVQIKNLSDSTSYSSCKLNYRVNREWKYIKKEKRPYTFTDPVLQSSGDNGKTWDTVLVFNNEIWKKISPDRWKAKNYPNIKFFNDSIGIMHVDYSKSSYIGYLYRTANGGKTWQKTKEAMGQTLYLSKNKFHLINDSTAILYLGLHSYMGYPKKKKSLRN